MKKQETKHNDIYYKGYRDGAKDILERWAKSIFWATKDSKSYFNEVYKKVKDFK